MLRTAIGKRLRAVTARHRSNWRQWAADLADGKPEPTAADVVEAAAHLGIADPAEQLEHDSAIIREVRAAEATVERCEASRVERLAPFDGDVEKVRAAIDAAKAEVARLAEILDNATWPHGWTYKARADRLRRDNPHLFTEELR